MKLLETCRIRAVINVATDYCSDPQWEYEHAGISYLELDCRDERNFPLISKCYEPVRAFIIGKEWASSSHPSAVLARGAIHRSRNQASTKGGFLETTTASVGSMRL